MRKRQKTIKRHTNETRISLTFTIDGSGSGTISTGIAFFDHMLDLFRHHGLFDLELSVDGDLEIDGHHTVEDVGICLGRALREALGDAKGIMRYASGIIPMDEALCQVAIDISNRPTLVFNCDMPKSTLGSFDVELAEEFFKAFVTNAGITLHIDMLRGSNLHHMIEAMFKALGQILDRATQIDPRKSNIPSTKGVL